MATKADPALDQANGTTDGNPQHHALKAQPGRKGDPDHAQDGDGTLPTEVADAVESSDEDTQLAAELKSAVSSSDDRT